MSFMGFGLNIKNKVWANLSFRSIMISANKYEKTVEKLKKNPYYDKYADRIAALQKTSPEEFKQRVERQEKSKNENKMKFGSINTRQFTSVLNPKVPIDQTTIKKEDLKLDDIFRTELVQDIDATQIQVIWEEYHKDKEVLSATIPVETYNTIYECLKLYKTFVFPLPRDHGYEFMMVQGAGHTVHFTPLLAYQVHKENAPECLKMVHYTELQNKGIILMRGEYDKNVLNGQEAQCLANQFQMYYNGKDEVKSHLLEMFNKSPESFKHIDLISQLENITVA